MTISPLRLGAVLALSALLSFPLPAFSQEFEPIPLPAAEVSVGYTFMRDFSDDLPKKLNFPAGWYASAAVNLNQWLALVGEGTGSYKNDFDISYADLSPEANRALADMFSFDARVYTLMGGPRFFHKAGRFAPFVQVLVGGAHAQVKTIQTPMEGIPGLPRTTDTTNFALQPGGGLTVFLTGHVGLRLAADYRLIVDFMEGDENEYGNEFRVISGFTFNWGRR